MKRLPIGVCVVISIALVLVGLGFGTVRGFREDSARVEETLTEAGGLRNILYYRGADGLNLLAVAARHLPADDTLCAELRGYALTLTDETAELSALREADGALKSCFDRVCERVEETDTILQSTRDEQYLLMLKADAEKWGVEAANAAERYDLAAAAFNDSLNAPVSGFLAKLLGVRPCALYAEEVR